MNSTESRLLVGLHLPGTYTEYPGDSFVDIRLDKWGRAALIHGLLEAGAEVLVSRGNEAFTETDVLGGIVKSVGDGVELSLGRWEKGSVNVVRNITAVIGGGVPEMNHPKVRKIASDKLNTNIFLRELGLAKPFAPWSPGEDLSAAFDVIPDDEVALKPTSGKRGQGVVLGTKAEVAAYISEAGLTGAFLIEQRLRTKPLEGLRGRDPVEQEKIKAARSVGLASELRAYTFGVDGAEQSNHFVLRVAKPGTEKLGDDEWVYIDQASVPEETRSSARAIDMALQQKTGVRETHLAIDWTELDSGLYVPMEINAGEPQLVYKEDDPSTAAVHVDRVVKQLMRAAVHGV